MRICIVCSLYLDNHGYVENMMARELAKKGHQVLHIAGGDFTHKSHTRLVAGGLYEVLYVPRLRLPRTIHLSWTVGNAIRDFAPDGVFWIGPGRYFGDELITAPDLAQIPVANFHSDNVGMHQYNWRSKNIAFRERIHALGYHILRGRIVRAACRRANLIVAMWKGTRDILLMSLPNPQERAAVDRKIVDLPQGYDPERYQYSPAVRSRVREELGLSAEDVVIVASSRFASGRKGQVLDASVRGILSALRHDARLRAIIVGFTDNSISAELKGMIAGDSAGDRVICHAWANQERLSELYCAGDVALFGNTTVSASAAVGAGLVCCLPDVGTMDPLITRDGQGLFFPFCNSEGIGEQLATAAAALGQRSVADRQELRRQFVEASRWLGYDRLVDTILERLLSKQRVCSGFSST